MAADAARHRCDRLRVLIQNPDIDAIMVSATPETVHYPMALEALQAGKHVLLEKPIALTLAEADHLIEEAESRNLKFAIGYSQRFNVKQALVERSFEDGTSATPSASSSPGTSRASWATRSPAASSSHRRPWRALTTSTSPSGAWSRHARFRVYAQGVNRFRKPQVRRARHHVQLDHHGQRRHRDDQRRWVLPKQYRNYSQMWIEEFVGTNGALMLDDTHRDVVMSTMSAGTVFPLSTMPGEAVLHAYSGPMERETQHFIDAVARDREVLVPAAQARNAMELYLAADLSWERNEPVSLPLVADEVDLALAASVRY